MRLEHRLFVLCVGFEEVAWMKMKKGRLARVTATEASAVDEILVRIKPSNLVQRLFTQLLILFTIVSLSGGQWMGIQIIGWATMAQERQAETGVSFVEAVGWALGDAAPCEHCDAAQSVFSEAQKALSSEPTPKLLPLLADAPRSLHPKPKILRTFADPPMERISRTIDPPLPPPRSC